MSLSKQTFTLTEDGSSFDCYIILLTKNNKEEYYFTGADTAKCLGYKDPQKAISNNVSKEWRFTWDTLKGWIKNPILQVPKNWQPHTVFISEPGLNALIMKSKKPEAVKFQKWVFEEVIPSIRRTGKYDINQPQAGSSKTELSWKEEKSKLLVSLYKKERDIALRDAQLAKKDAELAAKDLEFQKELFKEKLRVHELTTMNKYVTIGYGAMGIVAESNIKQNDELLSKLSDVVDRVVPSLEDQPQKEQFIACYQIGDKVKVTRCQNIELENRDKIQKRMCEEEQGLRIRKKSKIMDWKYGWLRGADKFHQVRCANPITLWNFIKKSYMFFGFEFTCKTKTEVRFLKDMEIREKYLRHLGIYKRVMNPQDVIVNKEEKAIARQFEAFNFKDANDAVSKCLTVPEEIQIKFSGVVEEAIAEINKQLQPKSIAIRNPAKVNHQEAIDFVNNRGKIKLSIANENTDK